MIRAEIKNLRRLNAKFRALPREATLETRRAVRLGGLAIENTAKASIRQPGKGRTYSTRFFTDASGRVRPIGTRPEHTASAPGDPPASDTGILLGSIESLVVDDGFAVEVGSALNYARWLEFGTKATPSRKATVKPRPFLHPAFRANRRQVGRAIMASMRAVLKRAGAL